MRLELYYPVKPHTRTQGVFQNFNSSYGNQGLIGHTGTDIVAAWDSPIYSATKGYVYKVINRDNSDLSQFRAVFVLVPVGGDEYVEVCYGHLEKINVKEGDNLVVGDFIGTMGNTGEVYTNGKLVTTEQKLAGNRAGTHLHFQTRNVRQTRIGGLGQYISDPLNASQPYTDIHGNMYWTYNFNNGINGCYDHQNDWVGKYAKDVYDSYIEQMVLVVKSLLRILNTPFVIHK